MANDIYQFSAKTILGQDEELSRYRGKVLLVVNTASKCGFTPQYEELQALYEKYKDQGLEILAFPCNQFGRQEPGTESQIQNFCKTQYNITFPVYTKINVNGKNAHPLYRYLTTQAPGILGTRNIKWNFTKFLVNEQGQVMRRFASVTKPAKLEKHIIDLL